jgi:hypothetical protein
MHSEISHRRARRAGLTVGVPSINPLKPAWAVVLRKRNFDSARYHRRDHTPSI